MIYPYDGGKTEEGKKLAQELIRHGVKDKTIADILGVTKACIFEWRQLVRRTGWTDADVVGYEEPGELERKLKELENYKGIFSTKDMQEKYRQKQQEAIKLFEQGKTGVQVQEMLHVSYDTVARWRKLAGVVPEKKEKIGIENAAWAIEWRQEWDKVRLQILGMVSNEQATA